MASDRHAYLIICHSRFGQLQQLLKALDDARSDIYILIDQKTREIPSEETLKGAAPRSGVFPVPRTDVAWSGDSQIRAELILLKAATRTEHAYYHLISGQDLPLCSQDAMHRYFEENAGLEFVDMDRKANETREFLTRVKRYDFFRNRIGRNSGRAAAAWQRLTGYSFRIQDALGVDRTKGREEKYFKGSNWFSITHGFAKHLLSREAEIKKYFFRSWCADELFLQSILMDSPYAAALAPSDMRFIDWDRGSPYTFRTEDEELLMNSGRLFARKFCEETDSEIIRRIVARVTQ